MSLSQCHDPDEMHRSENCGSWCRAPGRARWAARCRCRKCQNLHLRGDNGYACCRSRHTLLELPPPVPPPLLLPPPLLQPPGAPQLQVAAALKQLADSRQTPPSPQHVAWLLDVLDAPACSAASALHALALLARWARQQSMQPPQARQHELLRRVAASAQRLLGPTSGLLGGAGGPQLAAACVLVLGNVAAAATDLTVIEDAAEAVGTALLCGQLGAAEARATSDAAAAVGALLPSLLVSVSRACCFLSRPFLLSPQRATSQ